MSLLVSVVCPVRNGGPTLRECLAGLAGQSIARDAYEVVVVADSRSSDDTLAIAETAATAAGIDIRVIIHAEDGAAAARNLGIAAARAPHVAMIDADCVPTRTWLAELLRAAGDGLGAAGRTVGYESTTDAARYVDLTGGLDPERHLKHPRYPWAQTCNLVYRRDALEAVGGFDVRFVTYEGCDLHTRLRRSVGGAFAYAPRAVVLHRHRAGWHRYWRQQRAYGRGYGQFLWAYRDEIGWSVRREVAAWGRLLPAAARALAFRDGDRGLITRGTVVKGLAQRLGVVTTYWSPRARRRWAARPHDPVSALAARPAPGRGIVGHLAPWWTPWGAAGRLRRIVRTPSDLPLFVRIGWFMLRLPADVERTHFGAFQETLRTAPRPRARDPWTARDRIARLRDPWLRRRGMAGRDNCYIRAITLVRFVDPGEHTVALRVGAEWYDRPGGVLRGHAWVTVDGEILEGPPETAEHGRLQELRLTPSDPRPTTPV
jgi:glycosyltransferase involved in cell wall biosynthesis